MTETYDPDLLVTFLAVAETGSFSEAARRRGLRQSTVSQQVRRLEAETRRRLFDRDTHNVALTVDGQALTVLAGEILAAYSRAERYFSNAELRGRVRFGASEDFALSSLLPQVLRAFSSRHPQVDLEMTVGLAADLYQGMDEGALDLIFAKRRAGDGRGRMVWREEMVWIAAPDWRRDPERPLPLVLYPPRSITREAVLAALEKADIPWRIACTCGSLSGLVGAVLGGLGVARNRRVSRRKERSPSVPRRGCRRSARRSSSLSRRSAGRARRSRRWRTRSSSSAARSMRKRPEARVSELHRKERSSAACGSA